VKNSKNNRSLSFVFSLRLIIVFYVFLLFSSLSSLYFFFFLNKQRFVNEIDQLTHLETQPLGTVPEWAKWEFVEGVPMSELDPLLAQLRRTVSERRMDVKMAFKNFDKTNRGVVTKAQFLSILTYLGMFPPAPSDRDMLCKAYALREPGQGDKIHYATFAKRVDPPTTL
jgi:hypothetical protein